MNTTHTPDTNTATITTDDIPYGYCHCGCGERTPIAPQTRSHLGWIKGEPVHYINGHNRRGETYQRRGPLDPVITIYAHPEDAQLDADRIERLMWHQALDADLRALKDYVHDHQAIIWRPGCGVWGGKASSTTAQEVHLTSHTSCTCSRFKLRGTCAHMAFLQRIDQHGIVLTTDTPIHARELEAQSEAA